MVMKFHCVDQELLSPLGESSPELKAMFLSLSLSLSLSESKDHTELVSQVSNVAHELLVELMII